MTSALFRVLIGKQADDQYVLFRRISANRALHSLYCKIDSMPFPTGNATPAPTYFRGSPERYDANAEPMRQRE